MQTVAHRFVVFSTFNVQYVWHSAIQTECSRHGQVLVGAYVRITHLDLEICNDLSQSIIFLHQFHGPFIAYHCKLQPNMKPIIVI